jgi:hypothetical protein
MAFHVFYVYVLRFICNFMYTCKDETERNLNMYHGNVFPRIQIFDIPVWQGTFFKNWGMPY